LLAFSEFRNIVRSLVNENKNKLRRNFPNLVYKQLINLSDTDLPKTPPVTYSNEWKGWRDLLGPTYFSIDDTSRKNKKTDNKPEIIPGIRENNDFDVRWNVRFFELQQYYKEHGTLIVEQEQKTLQMWALNQRSLNKREILRKDRKAALERIHFDWEPQINEWDDYFNLLTSFKKLHGHVDVPSRYRPNYRLGQWIREQRIFHRDGTLRKSRIRRLESIGFRWVIPESERYLTLEQRGNNNGKK
jgi:hypothetical protein